MRNFVLILGALILFFSIAKANSQPTYVVKPGDTLYDISLAHGITWQELAQLNKIKNPHLIQIGARLKLPGDALHDGREPDYIYDISSGEKNLLVRLVYAEAGAEPFEGQVAVAAVVLNRVLSSRFPDTVHDVIHQPGQFIPVLQGQLTQTIKDTCVEAVERALRGEDPSGGALYFYNPAASQTMDYWRTKPVIKRIGNHNFTI